MTTMTVRTTVTATSTGAPTVTPTASGRTGTFVPPAGEGDED